MPVRKLSLFPCVLRGVQERTAHTCSSVFLKGGSPQPRSQLQRRGPHGPLACGVKRRLLSTRYLRFEGWSSSTATRVKLSRPFANVTRTMQQHYKLLPTAPLMDEHTLLLKRPSMRTDPQERVLQAAPVLFPVARRISRMRRDCPLAAPQVERHPHQDEQQRWRAPQDEDHGDVDEDKEDKKVFLVFGLELSIPRVVSCKIKVKLSC